jgi:glyoxylase-like metal-dependent hydrolase (beta-lactamase superfamily II)
MKIHHCNCASFCPFHSEKLMKRLAPELSNLITQCLIIESKDGIILVDSGIGQAQMEFGKRNKIQDFIIGTQYDEKQTMIHQLKARGIKREDVKHIFVTHLDYDHAGGVMDFPEATLHLLKDEWEVANFSEDKRDIFRYKRYLWQNQKKVEIYDGGELWKRKTKKIQLRGIEEKLFVIPLLGHTKGHAGLFIEKENTIFAGDAFMNHRQILDNYESRLLKIYNKITCYNLDQYYETIDQIRFFHKEEIKILNSHDPFYFKED